MVATEQNCAVSRKWPQSWSAHAPSEIPPGWPAAAAGTEMERSLNFGLGGLPKQLQPEPTYEHESMRFPLYRPRFPNSFIPSPTTPARFHRQLALLFLAARGVRLNLIGCVNRSVVVTLGKQSSHVSSLQRPATLHIKAALDSYSPQETDAGLACLIGPRLHLSPVTWSSGACRNIL